MEIIIVWGKVVGESWISRVLFVSFLGPEDRKHKPKQKEAQEAIAVNKWDCSIVGSNRSKTSWLLRRDYFHDIFYVISPS